MESVYISILAAEDVKPLLKAAYKNKGIAGLSEAIKHIDDNKVKVLAELDGSNAAEIIQSEEGIIDLLKCTTTLVFCETNLSATQISPIISNNHRLQSLAIAEPSLEHDEEKRQTIIDTLSSCTSLTSIHLSTIPTNMVLSTINKLNKNGAKSLTIEANTIIDNKGILSAGINKIFADNPHLELLSLSGGILVSRYTSPSLRHSKHNDQPPRAFSIRLSHAPTPQTQYLQPEETMSNTIEFQAILTQIKEGKIGKVLIKCLRESGTIIQFEQDDTRVAHLKLQEVNAPSARQELTQAIESQEKDIQVVIDLEGLGEQALEKSAQAQQDRESGLKLARALINSTKKIPIELKLKNSRVEYSKLHSTLLEARGKRKLDTTYIIIDETAGRSLKNDFPEAKINLPFPTKKEPEAAEKVPSEKKPAKGPQQNLDKSLTDNYIIVGAAAGAALGFALALVLFGIPAALTLTFVIKTLSCALAGATIGAASGYWMSTTSSTQSTGKII